MDVLEIIAHAQAEVSWRKQCMARIENQRLQDANNMCQTEKDIGDALDTLKKKTDGSFDYTWVADAGVEQGFKLDCVSVFGAQRNVCLRVTSANEIVLKVGLETKTFLTSEEPIRKLAHWLAHRSLFRLNDTLNPAQD